MFLLGIFILSSDGASQSLYPFSKDPGNVRWGLGVELESGIGKTRDRLIIQPWNYSNSAQIVYKWRWLKNYGLIARTGYTYFQDEPIVHLLVGGTYYRADLKVHELTVGLSQEVRVFNFLLLEQGYTLLFPFYTEYDLYRTTLSEGGWTPFTFYSSEELDRSFYQDYPLLGLIYGLGLDITSFGRAPVPISLYLRLEIGLNNMYLGNSIFAGMGKEQIRQSFGIQSMIFNWGKLNNSQNASPFSKKIKHNYEIAFELGGGLGNLQSVSDNSRFQMEGMYSGALKFAYLYNSRYRFGLTSGYQLRRYTESEYNTNANWYRNEGERYKRDYYDHNLSYYNTDLWAEFLPAPFFVTGMGFRYSWLLPFGNSGWSYIESDSTNELTKESISEPNKLYHNKYDPAILLKAGIPFDKWTKIPLELNFIYQWGLRNPNVITGFYTVSRPVYTSFSINVAYVFKVFK